MNKIQNLIIFIWSLSFFLLSVIILLSSRHFHISLLALAISFGALTTYLFLENRKDKNDNYEEDDKNYPDF
jgi:hypothetical protein